MASQAMIFKEAGSLSDELAFSFSSTQSLVPVILLSSGWQKPETGFGQSSLLVMYLTSSALVIARTLL